MRLILIVANVGKFVLYRIVDTFRALNIVNGNRLYIFVVLVLVLVMMMVMAVVINWWLNDRVNMMVN